jgi:hypothetical protein
MNNLINSNKKGDYSWQKNRIRSQSDGYEKLGGERGRGERGQVNNTPAEHFDIPDGNGAVAHNTRP